MPAEKLIRWTELSAPKTAPQGDHDLRYDDTGSLKRYLRLADLLLKGEEKQKRAG